MRKRLTRPYRRWRCRTQGHRWWHGAVLHHCRRCGETYYIDPYTGHRE